jgi:predicted ribosome quality control (RQC) complex YloA/Tae2 family protein
MLYDSGNANSSYGLGISGSVLWFNSASVFKFYANGTQIGWVDASGFRNGSDLRLKKDIRALESPLQRLLLLDGVSYSWINENFPRKRVMGFISQDLAKVFPEVVDADENGYLSVNYSQLIAPMVEALKEEHEQKQKLENKVEKLQNKLDNLIKTLCEKDQTEELCQK